MRERNKKKAVINHKKISFSTLNSLSDLFYEVSLKKLFEKHIFKLFLSRTEQEPNNCQSFFKKLAKLLQNTLQSTFESFLWTSISKIDQRLNSKLNKLMKWFWNETETIVEQKKVGKFWFSIWIRKCSFQKIKRRKGGRRLLLWCHLVCLNSN